MPNLLILYVGFRTRKLIRFMHKHWPVSVIKISELPIAYDGCLESIEPFWISREPEAWPWCNLAASQRRPYCAYLKSHSSVGLVSRQWDAVDWACVLCDRRNHNGRSKRSASLRQWTCPFYSSREGFFGKASHHPGLSATLQPIFVSLRLPAFPKTKIAVEKGDLRILRSHGTQAH